VNACIGGTGWLANLRIGSSCHNCNGYREQQREIVEGERAKEQVMLALQIASTKLNAAQRKVRQAGEHNTTEQASEHQ
jgi:hypothetical protein